MTSTTTMARDEAARIITGRDGDAGRLSRLSKAALERILDAELRQRGRTRLFGQSSKDELVSEILELRWPPASHTEAIHVLHHAGGVTNSACGFCDTPA